MLKYLKNLLIILGSTLLISNIHCNISKCEILDMEQHIKMLTQEIKDKASLLESDISNGKISDPDEIKKQIEEIERCTANLETLAKNYDEAVEASKSMGFKEAISTICSDKLNDWKRAEFSMTDVTVAALLANYIGDKVDKKYKLSERFKEFTYNNAVVPAKDKLTSWRNGNFSTSDFIGIAATAGSALTAYLINSKFKITQAIRNKCGNFVAGLFGREKMDAKHDAFFKDLVKELKMDPNIEFRRMGPFLTNKIGHENACVLPCMKYVFVGDKLFEKLTPEERKFVIGHELMHIDHNHGLKIIGISTLAAIFGSKYLPKYSKYVYDKFAGCFSKETAQKYLDNKLMRDYVIPGIACLPINATLYLALMALTRYHEREADQQAVRRLGTTAIEGGMSFFKKYEHNHCDPNDSKVKKLMQKLLVTHPTNEERMEMMQSELQRIAAAAA